LPLSRTAPPIFPELREGTVREPELTRD